MMTKENGIENEKLRVLFVSPETAPFSKSGGLGDVAASLPKELVKQGVDCRVATPKYGSIPGELLRGIVSKTSFETRLGWRNQHAGIYELETGGVTVYFIANDFYFARERYYGYGDDHERFAFFCKAALEMAGVIDFRPDIVHANDWQTGLCAVYLRDKLSGYTFYKQTQSLFTIHNLQYQGVFGRHVLSDIDLNDGYFSEGGLEFYNNISLMKAGIAHSSAVSTVSKTYAGEITSPAYGFSMDGIIRSRGSDLYGIVNGIDYDSFNPETDTNIYANFNITNYAEGKARNKAALQRELGLPEWPEVSLFVMISRLTDQKGFDILSIVMDEFLNNHVQLVILGQGDARYEEMLNFFRYRYPEKCSVFMGFSETLARKLYAAGDFFLMPSLFEPCGLGQLIAMRYGTVPIARKTGGLADTIQDFSKDKLTGNGFLFEDYVASGLMWAINKALDVFGDGAQMGAAIKNAMSCDYSWGNSAKMYIELYEKILTKAKK